jgi:thiol-disulfide isomerase/thioredoxin
MTRTITAWFVLVLLGIIGYGTYTVYQYRQTMNELEYATEPAQEALYLPPPAITEPQDSGQGRTYVELVSPAGFINTEPMTIGSYVGNKVILVVFLTYGCINCQNTFDFLRAMEEKYAEKGLQIIAIHTPEFAYERTEENVREALVKKARLTFPIVLDNEYMTWRAYKNNYWPARYLIDLKGNIIFTHAGEGAYTETEDMIRNLLKVQE